MLHVQLPLPQSHEVVGISFGGSVAQPPQAFAGGPHVFPPAPPQQPLGHDAALHSQLPPEQVWPDEHRLPHPPQFELSLLVLTHPVPHCVGVPAAQAMLQLDPLHEADPVVVPDEGPGHGVPHTPPLPQPFWVPGFSHMPLQLTVPKGQLHTPPEHCCPPLHAFPQLPQSLLSVW